MIAVGVEGLTKRYGHVEALRDVSLGFEPGRLTAILGPSGCGKTTLLRSIAGFARVDAGTIRFGGEDVTGLPPQARATAMVFQNYALWPHMTVFDNVAYGLRLKRLPREQIRRRALQALPPVEVGDVEAGARREPRAPPRRPPPRGGPPPAPGGAPPRPPPRPPPPDPPRHGPPRPR